MAYNINQLDRLKAQLLTAGLSQKDSPLFQIINSLIDALRNSVIETNATISGSGSPSSGLTNQSFLTINNDLATLSNSRRLLAGLGIIFDDSVPGIRTINSASVGDEDHVPVSTGAEPLQIMSDGAGHVLLTAYTP